MLLAQGPHLLMKEPGLPQSRPWGFLSRLRNSGLWATLKGSCGLEASRGAFLPATIPTSENSSSFPGLPELHPSVLRRDRQSTHVPCLTGKGVQSPQTRISLCQLGPKAALLGTKPHIGLCENHTLSLYPGPRLGPNPWSGLGKRSSSVVSSTSPSHTLTPPPYL